MWGFFIMFEVNNVKYNLKPIKKMKYPYCFTEPARMLSVLIDSGAFLDIKETYTLIDNRSIISFINEKYSVDLTAPYSEVEKEEFLDYFESSANVSTPEDYGGDDKKSNGLTFILFFLLSAINQELTNPSGWFKSIEFPKHQ